MSDKIKSKDKEYLGDGVYLGHDGYQLWITTENGYEVTNAIAIEPNLIPQIQKYWDNLLEKYKKGT